MRTALTISAVGHAALLLWGLVTFVAKPHTAKSVESVAVDIISAKDFSQLTAGSRNAPKVEANARPLVETVGERRPVDDPTGKIGKKEIADTTEKPPLAPTPKPPTPTEKKPPEPPKVSEPKPPEPKRDLIAEAIRKDQAKKVEQKKAEAKAQTQPKREAQPKQEQPKKDPPPFDPKRIQQALIDKREPQRLAATGDVPNTVPSLGGANGHAAVLSQSEIDALRERLSSLWTPPLGAGNPDELTVLVTFRLKKDGTVYGAVTARSPFGYWKSPLFMAASASALRAVASAQPFDMLKPENYEQWKELEINFDPRDMIRG